MTEIQVTINIPSGLHARPAAMLVQKAANYKSKVKLAANNKVVDAKSILAVMGLGLKQYSLIKITAEGEDEVLCIQALKELIENNFGEDVE